MKNFSKVSIIIPSYNHQSYVLAAVESVLQQDWPQIDLIVIDDGSTDGSPELLSDFHKKRGGFRLLLNTNKGLIKTLNEGVNLACGDFICELASDDILLQNSLAKRANYLSEHPEIGVVFADAYYMFGSKKTKRLMNDRKDGFRSDKHSLLDLLSGKAKILFATGLFRKEVITGLGGFDEDFRYFEDVSMWFKLSLSTQIGYLNEPVMYYRKHGLNTSLSQKLSVRREKVLALEKLLHLKTGDATPAIKKALSREYQRYLKFAINHAVNIEEHAVFFRKAIRLHPLSLKTWCYGMLGPRKECK